MSGEQVHTRYSTGYSFILDDLPAELRPYTAIHFRLGDCVYLRTPDGDVQVPPEIVTLGDLDNYGGDLSKALLRKDDGE